MFNGTLSPFKGLAERESEREWERAQEILLKYVIRLLGKGSQQ